MKKIAILATDGYEDLELHYPRIRLHEAGYETHLISLSTEIIKGKHGYPIKPDLAIKDANPEEYSGVILPGGSRNPDHLRRYSSILDFVRKIDDESKLVGAICHAGWILISANIVEGRKATSYFAIKDDMINAGVDFVDQSVVIDKNLITSRTPDDLPDFMKAILDFLQNL
ncbi:MAG: Deglycase PfpI [Promethearchaeota archaeon]|nr:MAG: Deglycase PfpI [Candidatus Lokiarchaeota archaeon]